MNLFDKFREIFITEEDVYEDPPSPIPSKKPRLNIPQHSNVVNIPFNQVQVKVIIVEPVKFDDSQKIADCLREQRPVVVNFENTEPEVIRRITDFVTGTIYAIDGNLQAVGRDILLCAPKNVDIAANAIIKSAKNPDGTQEVRSKEFTPWREK